MERYMLSKSDLPLFLDGLHDVYRVVAPRKVGPDVVFDDLARDEMPVLDYVNTLLPPKSLFFKRRETLFDVKGGRNPALTPPPEEKPVAIFGLRSCDSTALSFFKKFFEERGFNDSTITGPIRNSLRVTLACNVPGPDCFCVCCDGGPFLADHFDIQLVDLGKNLLAEIGTPAGKAAIGMGKAPFRPPTREEIDAKRRLVKAVDTTFERRSFITQGIKKTSLGKIAQQQWEEWAEDCQACGGCCYVCPTCSCFTVNDRETGPDQYSRERTWDSCLYAGFTREASEHNPRATAGERLKRRFFHKMSYQYVERMGRHGCVGCGRCVTTCMGGLDISNLLLRMSDAS